MYLTIISYSRVTLSQPENSNIPGESLLRVVQAELNELAETTCDDCNEKGHKNRFNSKCAKHWRNRKKEKSVPTVLPRPSTSIQPESSVEEMLIDDDDSSLDDYSG